MAILPMSVSRPRPLRRTPIACRILAVTLSLSVLLPATPLRACPFCSAVSTTLRQEMEVMDAVVIATMVEGSGPLDEDTGEVTMKIEKVLKGSDLVKEGQQVRAS